MHDLRASVDREQAERIIAQHGWTPDQCTVCVGPCTLESVECPASFNANLGVKNYYAIADLRDWLGY